MGIFKVKAKKRDGKSNGKEENILKKCKMQVNQAEALIFNFFLFYYYSLQPLDEKHKTSLLSRFKANLKYTEF